MQNINRRKFIHTSALTGLGLSICSALPAMMIGKNKYTAQGKKIGIIGLDTSHSTAFVEALNSSTPDVAYDAPKSTPSTAKPVPRRFITRS